MVNIEILDLYGRTNVNVSIQSECRCPSEYPRNENENSTNCLSNKNELEYFANKVFRLNSNAHPLGYLNDDDFATNWISCILTITNPITITMDFLNGVYIIQRVEIFFSSMPPTNLLIERYSNNHWIVIQTYSVDCEDSSLVCVKLPKYNITRLFALMS